MQRSDIAGVLVVLLGVVLVVLPGWPLAAALAVMAWVCLGMRTQEQDERESTRIDEDSHDLLTAMRTELDAAKAELEKQQARVTTLENRTRPVGGR